MDSFLNNLTDIVNIEKVEKILSAYTKATKMSSLITDAQGNPLTTEEQFHPMCRKIRKNPKLNKRCIKCDALGGLNATLNDGKPYIYKCHAGLVEVVAPILLENKPIGNLFTGQILLSDKDSDKVNYLNDEITNLEDYPDLIDDYHKWLKTAPSIGYDQVISYANLIIEISNYIAKISYEKILKERIQDQENKLYAANNIKLKSKLMVNQYNSAFITEAFSTIYNYAILENASTTAELLYSLTSIFKRNISTDSHYISVKNELDDIINQCNLYNMTFDQSIQIIRDIPPELDFDMVPITCIQPIILNFFLPLLPSGHLPIQIRIKGRKENNLLFFDIFSTYISFPNVNFTTDHSITLSECHFSKISYITLELVAQHLRDLYSDQIEMYTENNHFYFIFPAIM